MYSREERIRAVELWIKYGKRSRAVIRELGYPSRTLLPLWYKDYLQEQETGILHNCRRGVLKYTEEQKQVAIDHYLEHGKCMAQQSGHLDIPVGTCSHNGAGMNYRITAKTLEMLYNIQESRNRMP